MKYPAHTFLFDDDDDTDRSGQTQGAVPYSPPATQISSHYSCLTSKSSYLTSKSSCGNYSLQQHQGSTTTSLFTCCGFTIDLSHKRTYSSNSRSTLDDTPTRRSTITRHPNSPSKISCSQSSNDRIIRQQKTVCYRSTNMNRPITRRRAATVVHCSHSTPVSTLTTLTNKPPIHRSISKEKSSLPFEKLSPIIDIPLTIPKDGYKTNINLTEPTIIVKTDCDELSLPASIIETC
jgi:hypothetical protein